MSSTSKLWPAILFLALVLTGCSATTSLSAPATQPPITLAPQPSSTLQPTFTATQQPSGAPQPSQTVEPTQAAISTRRAATSAAWYAQGQATSDALATIAAPFPTPCGSFNEKSFSPDGNWMTTDCGSGSYEDGEFRVAKRDGQKKIILSHHDLPLMGLPDLFVTDVSPIGWSNDSQYLYFSTYRCCVDTDAFTNDHQLYRLDIQSGTWSIIVDGYFNYYSFSPSGRRLLYIPRDLAGGGNPVIFHLLDLKAGAEQLIRLDGFEQAGHVLWHPDGKSFFATAKAGNRYSGNEKFALVLVSLDEPAVAVLTTPSRHEIFATQWISENVAAILDYAPIDYPLPFCNPDTEICDQTLYYDVKAKQFVTPTPTP